ncbi:ROK family protein, partial [Candidatus Aerophobetes bacterium]|nr:ROK family protein [Candidatus Aerophobetes bacterium]
IGTGIGGGIVIERKLYFGRQGYAGEIGHQIIDPAGPICGCGNRGCLEAFASAGSIIVQAKEMIKKGKPTLIEKLIGGDLDKITPKIVAQAAREGDAVARKIWEREAFYLGIGIANLVVILNPQAVIIAGGISKAFDLMIDRIKETLRERILIEVDVEKLKILKGKLGDMAGAIGAACWAREKFSGRKTKHPEADESI